MENPSDVYFKLDDDIVYISPNVFGTMLKNKNPSDCFIHFANIVSNWRCNWLHQQIGVFDTEVNPKGLKIDYHPNANGNESIAPKWFFVRFYITIIVIKQVNTYFMEEITRRIGYASVLIFSSLM